MLTRFNRILAYFLPRPRDLIFTAVFLGALLFGSQMLDGDLGRHLTIGKLILDTYQIPIYDQFSFTKPGESRPAYEWFAQVLFATADRLLNLDGVVLLTALILAATFAVVYADSIRRSSAPLLALLLNVLAVTASKLHWLARPHVFSFLFFAIWIQCLEKLQKEQKGPLWFFPALMLIWANTHGGFIFGLLAWLAYFAGWLWKYLHKIETQKTGKQLIIIGGISIVATVITPSLWRNWEAVLNNRSVYILSRTIETRLPDLLAANILPFTGLLTLAIVLLFITPARQADASHLFLLGGLALVSLLVARNIPFFAIASAPILADWIKGFLAKSRYSVQLERSFLRIDQSLHSFLWPLLISLAGLGLFINHSVEMRTPVNQFSTQAFPVRASDWMEEHPMQGRMFNDINWGGYLLYRLWPAQHVFVDNQTDFYGETFIKEYIQVMSLEAGWENVLRKYQVTWAILPSDKELVDALQENLGWQIVYHDPTATILRSP